MTDPKCADDEATQGGLGLRDGRELRAATRLALPHCSLPGPGRILAVMKLNGPLISAAELLAHSDDPALRVADVRWYLTTPGGGRAAFEAGHIPGAIFVDLDRDLAAPPGPGRHPLPSPSDFASRMAKLGIGDGHFVVAYDDVGGSVAARLWWMLDDLGHAGVAVLDGGIDAWVEAGGRLLTDEPEWPPASLHLAGAWRRTIDQPELRARLGSLTLLDARAPERYRGDVEPVDAAAGHIPTARNAHYAGNLDATGRFRAATELAERFRSVGAAEGSVVTSCGSGVNACHNTLAMRLAGLPDPFLYPGSFSDWSRSGLPVRTGDEPGEP